MFRSVASSCTRLPFITNTPSHTHRLFHSTPRLLDSHDQDLPWITNTAPSQRFWDTKANQKKYLDYIFNKQQYSSHEDWYKIKKADFTGPVGKSFISHFENNSPNEAIINIYGTRQQPLHPWKFAVVSPDFWETGNNQRKYLEWLGKTLNYSSMEDWYKVGADNFHKNGGRSLLGAHDNSIPSLLEFVFPEHGWLSWKFQKLPAGYWNDLNNAREFLNWMATDLKLGSMEDWLLVDIETLKKYGVVKALAHFGNLRKLLTLVYPEHPWHLTPKPKRDPITAPATPSPTIPTAPPITPSPAIPSDSTTTPPVTPPVDPTTSTPSTVPLTPKHPPTASPTKRASTIPEPAFEPPPDKFVYNWSESKFLLEEIWNSKQDPTDWWMLYNPGGMRVMWEGKARKFYTQTGGVISPPSNFSKKLPRDVNLDGTLTCVEGKVHYSVNAHLRANPTDWSGVTFNIFDIPSESATIEERQALIEELGLQQDNISVTPLIRCESLSFLLEKAKESFEVGTDSILLRSPGSKYEKGRSKALQRAVMYQLQPALVTSVEGPFAIKCVFTDDTDFAVSHAMESPPSVGSVVMIKFGNINQLGQPRHASAIHWQEPLNWDDIKSSNMNYLMLGDILLEM